MVEQVAGAGVRKLTPPGADVSGVPTAPKQKYCQGTRVTTRARHWHLAVLVLQVAPPA